MKTELPFAKTGLPFTNTDLLQVKMELPTINADSPVVFGLVLNGRRGKERVLIGTEECIQRRLAGDKNADVLYDQERPLGTLIFDHENQDRGWWCSQIFVPMRCALQSEALREENEKIAWKGLKEKLNSGNAVSCYVAFRALQYYAAGVDFGQTEYAVAVFERKMLVLTKTFRETLLGNGEVEVKEVTAKAEEIMRYTMSRDETALRILEPFCKNGQECLVAEDSLFLLIVSYLQKLQAWKMHFRICSVCGNLFVASSKHFSLCRYGNQCSRKQNRLNKRAYDIRTKDIKSEKAYQQVRDRMKKRLNKFIYQEGVSVEQIDRAESQYEVFRKRAVDRKNMVKTKNETVQFLDWLFEQERVFEKYLEV